MQQPPTVSVALPVYNGEQFVAAAIESVLMQTFRDFELIITDNASADSTGKICRALAERDSRIRYHRLRCNIGAIMNFQRAYHLCQGKYVHWQAHDDLLEPQFLERCVAALEADPTAVLAYPQSRYIASDGSPLRDYTVKLATDSHRPAERFGAIACAAHKHTSNHEIFGLMRKSASDQIPQQGGYAASDRVFLRGWRCTDDSCRFRRCCSSHANIPDNRSAPFRHTCAASAACCRA